MQLQKPHCVLWTVSALNTCRQETGRLRYSPMTRGKGQLAGTWRGPDSAVAKGI